MTPTEWTAMGGSNEAFLTTQWTLMQGVSSSLDRDRALIGVLLEKYWRPIYCYLRRKGYDNEQAKDLTQGFFHEIVLNKSLIQRADQAKGRFRSFLLHALGQYLINEKDKQFAQKRMPKGGLVALEVADSVAVPATMPQFSPEDSYNYAWLSTLLDEVLEEVKLACMQDKLETHWRVFHAHVLRPILEGIQPKSLSDLCTQHGVKDEKQASNMTITVKRRFQSVLKEHVRRTVLEEDQISEELATLMKFIAKSAQHQK